MSTLELHHSRLVWLAIVSDVTMTLWSFVLPMFVIGAGWEVVSAQLPNIQLSALPPILQGKGGGFAETGKELGIGLGTAIIGSIMFSMAIGGFVDNVAREANLSLSSGERTEAILLIEDEALPAEAIAAVGQVTPNLEQLGNEAFVEGFQIAITVVAGFLLLSLLPASFIPRVPVEAVKSNEVREAVADVSGKRL